ncbi:MAG: hypothetical protein ACTHMI_16020 [Mucilaginibacter sp.]
MKPIKRVLRLCALILFLMLALAGIGLYGVPPTLTKDRKLFADTEQNEARGSEENETEYLKLSKTD